MPRNFDSEQIRVLTAVAQAMIGPDVLTNAPTLHESIDVLVDEMSPSARDDLDRSLNYLGSRLFMGFLQVVTGVDVEFESFDQMTLDQRRRFLNTLESSDDADLKTMHVALTDLVTTAFYRASTTTNEAGPRLARPAERARDRRGLRGSLPPPDEPPNN
jgi:hypothetical protein